MSNNFVREGNLSDDAIFDNVAKKIHFESVITGTGSPVTPPSPTAKRWLYVDRSLTPAILWLWDPSVATWVQVAEGAGTAHTHPATAVTTDPEVTGLDPASTNVETALTELAARPDTGHRTLLASSTLSSAASSVLLAEATPGEWAGFNRWVIEFEYQRFGAGVPVMTSFILSGLTSGWRHHRLLWSSAAPTVVQALSAANVEFAHAESIGAYRGTIEIVPRITSIPVPNIFLSLAATSSAWMIGTKLSAYNASFTDFTSVEFSLASLDFAAGSTWKVWGVS